MPGDRADLFASVRAVSDVIRTTLGPFGANKLIVQGDGTVTTTAVGSVAIDRLDVHDPAVTLLQRAAADFRTEHGDGSATVIVLTGALLDEADRLHGRGLHPTAIERGFREALSVATDELDGRTVGLSSVGATAVARSALTATRDPFVREQTGAFVGEVATTLIDAHGIEAFDHRRVGIVTRTGGAQSQTELVDGVVLDERPVSESMPRRRNDAGIALVSSTVDVRRIGSETSRTSGVDLSLEAESFEDRAAIGDREREAFRQDLRAAIDAGCRVLATRRAVNDRVKTVLANHGVLAVQRVDEEDMDRLARATGARVVPGLHAVTTETLGTADVAVQRNAGRDMTVIRSGDGEPTYTLFCRAPDPRSVDSFERSVRSALAAVEAAIRRDTVVPGGGAIEVCGARAVRRHARSIDRREGLAAAAFASALWRLPRTLARTAGIDPQKGLADMRAAHADGTHAAGVDAFDGAIRDVLDDDPIVEPADTKRAVWAAATDLAVKLARIDERLAATDLDSDTAVTRPRE